MGPTRAWREPPARHGFATQRERLLWAHGYNAVVVTELGELARALDRLMGELGEAGHLRAAAGDLPPEQWLYPFMAGMARAVGDRDWRR